MYYLGRGISLYCLLYALEYPITLGKVNLLNVLVIVCK